MLRTSEKEAARELQFLHWRREAGKPLDYRYLHWLYEPMLEDAALTLYHDTRYDPFWLIAERVITTAPYYAKIHADQARSALKRHWHYSIEEVRADVALAFCEAVASVRYREITDKWYYFVSTFNYVLNQRLYCNLRGVVIRKINHVHWGPEQPVLAHPVERDILAQKQLTPAELLTARARQLEWRAPSDSYIPPYETKIKDTLWKRLSTVSPSAVT